MGRISADQTRRHDKACELLKIRRDLHADEIEYVYANWTPMASHNVGKGGAFFTPEELASELTLWTVDRGHVLDLAAGIGMLSWQMLLAHAYEETELKITAIELNGEFLEVGRKLLPQVNWVHGSIFDLKLLHRLVDPKPFGFECVISNPPFGLAPATSPESKWLRYNGPSHMRAMEVALYLGQKTVAILPGMDVPFWDSEPARPGQLRKHGYKPEASLSRNYERFHKLFPDIVFGSCSIDTSAYEGWQGAAPKVELVQLERDDQAADEALPYALPKEA